MIWPKWCHKKPRFCSWNGINFNFGWGSAPDLPTKLTTLPKVLLIGWLGAFGWTLADVYSTILNSFQRLVSVNLKFFFHMGHTVLKLFRNFLLTSYNIQGGPKSKPLSRIIIKSYLNSSLWLDFSSISTTKWSQEYNKYVLNILYVT